MYALWDPSPHWKHRQEEEAVRIACLAWTRRRASGVRGKGDGQGRRRGLSLGTQLAPSVVHLSHSHRHPAPNIYIGPVRRGVHSYEDERVSSVTDAT